MVNTARRAVHRIRFVNIIVPSRRGAAVITGRSGHAEPMDTTALTSAAAALDTHSEVLIARAHLVARQRAAMRWNSPAAARCRGVLDALCRQLLSSAEAMTALADRIRGCAARIGRAR